MPKLPTIVADRGINTGTTGAQASARDFYGGGLGEIAQGLGAVGQVANVAARQQQERTDTASIVESVREYSNQSALKEKELETDEDGPKKFNEWFEKTRAAFIATAPSKRAGERMAEVLSSDAKSKFANLVDTSSRVKAAKAGNALMGFSNDSIARLASNVGNPLVDAAGQFERDIAVSFALADAQFGDRSPEVKEQLAIQYAYGAKNVGQSKVAEKIARTHIKDEHKKTTVLNAVAEDKKIDNGIARHKQSKVIEQQEDDLLTGRPAVKIPREQWVGTGDAEKDDYEYGNYSSVFDNTQKVASTVIPLYGLNAGAAREKFEELRASMPDVEMKRALKMFDDNLRSIEDLQASNPSTWAAQYSPSVKPLADRYNNLARMVPADGAPDDLLAMVDGARAEMQNAIIKVQGAPEPGDSHPENYLYLPTQARSVLTDSQAKRYASEWTQGDSTQALSAMASFESEFDTPEKAAIGFNDVVREGKLKPGWRTLWLNRKSGFSQALALALKSDAKPIAENEVKIGLSRSDEWKGFAATMGGTMNSADKEDMRHAIIAMASVSGDAEASPQNAITAAAKALIGERLLTMEVNGQPFSIARDATPNVRYADDMRTELENRLRYTISAIDPTLLDTDNFTTLQGFTDTPEGQAKKARASSAILRNAFLLPTADGAAVTLFYRGDMEIPVELRNKQTGQPFRLPVAEWKSRAQKSTLEEAYNMEGRRF